MKKIAVLFLGLAAFSVLADQIEYKNCMKRCMEKLDDQTKCEFICKTLL